MFLRYHQHLTTGSAGRRVLGALGRGTAAITRATGYSLVYCYRLSRPRNTGNTQAEMGSGCGDAANHAAGQACLFFSDALSAP